MRVSQQDHKQKAVGCHVQRWKHGIAERPHRPRKVGPNPAEAEEGKGGEKIKNDGGEDDVIEQLGTCR